MLILKYFKFVKVCNTSKNGPANLSLKLNAEIQDHMYAVLKFSGWSELETRDKTRDGSSDDKASYIQLSWGFTEVKVHSFLKHL